MKAFINAQGEVLKAIEKEKALAYINDDLEKYCHIKGRIENDFPHEIYGIEEDEIFFMTDGEFVMIKGESLEDYERLTSHEYFKEDFNIGAESIAVYNYFKAQYNTVWDETCFLYIYDGTGYKEESYKKALDDTMVLDCLKMSDLEEIFEYYQYKEDGIEYLEKIINHLESVALRVDGELVSWALQREDGSLGFMYTKEAFRKKGLGIIVAKTLINKVLNQGKVVYLHIHLGNLPSQSLAKKLGFRQIRKIKWTGFKNQSFKKD